MKVKYGIQVNPGEKELYRIFKDLEKHGRATFSYPDLTKHRGVARCIGIRAAPLVKKNLFIPPLSSTNKHRMTGVMLPIGVQIKERKNQRGSYFLFQREK